MDPSLTALVGVLIGGILGFAGQWLSVHFALRTERMKLSYQRKADAYQNYILRSQLFIVNAEKGEALINFLQAIAAAQLVGSDEICTRLANLTSQVLAVPQNRPSAAFTEAMMQWIKSARELENLMRDELRRLVEK